MRTKKLALLLIMLTVVYFASAYLFSEIYRIFIVKYDLVISIYFVLFANLFVFIIFLFLCILLLHSLLRLKFFNNVDFKPFRNTKEVFFLFIVLVFVFISITVLINLIYP